MIPGGRRWLLAIAGALWAVSPLAQTPQVIDEVRAILRQQALVLPGEELLGNLSAENMAEALRQIDPWASWHSAAESPVDEEAPGIGADLYADSGLLWLMPYSDGPLYRAGIRDRVQLHAVDGRAVSDMTLAETARALSGVEGIALEIELCSDECRSIERLSLFPEPFRKHSVEQVEIAGQRLLRLRHFASRETRIFLQTLLAAEREDQPWIIDLRDCQGGDLYEAMDSAALFLDPGLSLASTYSRKGLTQHYRSPPEKKYSNPLTLLISGNTASAGELFAGILQAHRRARLVGLNSRGKCVSQTTRTLSDGSLLHFTNLEVVLPDGSRCQGAGVEPDLVLSTDEVASSRLLLERLGREGRSSLIPQALDKSGWIP